MVSIDPFAFHLDAHVPEHTIVRIMDHADVDVHSGMLSTVDIQRLAMLKDAGKRRDLERSLIAVKQELADLTGKSASQVDVTHDSKGAPALSSSPGMHISISRTAGWSAVAVSRQNALGIDIEHMRPVDWTSMQNMVCTSEETAFLSRLGADALPAFYRLWTAKEAVMKAVGEGFRMGARSLSLPNAFLTGAEPHALISTGHRVFSVGCTHHDHLMVSLATATD